MGGLFCECLKHFSNVGGRADGDSSATIHNNIYFFHRPASKLCPTAMPREGPLPTRSTPSFLSIATASPPPAPAFAAPRPLASGPQWDPQARGRRHAAAQLVPPTASAA